MHLQPPFRLATADDASALARFIMWAGEGLPMIVWQGMAAEGEDPWAVGTRRMAAKVKEEDVVVVDEGAGAVAGLMGYPITAPQPIDGMPPLFVPLQELENEVVGTWYVHVLATMPEARGRGWGGRLLALAEVAAAQDGRDEMSLIVSDANHGARRLYARSGYREAARRRAVKDGWDNPIEDWILLHKPLD